MYKYYVVWAQNNNNNNKTNMQKLYSDGTHNMHTIMC